MKWHHDMDSTHKKGLLFGLTIFVLMVLTIVNTHAQVPPASDQSRDSLRGNMNSEPSAASVNVDDDGRRDEVQGRRGHGSGSGRQNKSHKRRRDQFIDKDGDGINDNRCRGMGIMRGRRHGKSQTQGQ